MAIGKKCPIPGCERPHGASDLYCAAHGSKLIILAPQLVENGTRIAGKYEVTARIGSGGMGELYRAVQLQPHQEIAIKILHPEHMKEHSARFLAEAERAAQVRHPNCVTVYEVGNTDDGLLFIAMEYIPGCDLSDLIAREGPKAPNHDVTTWTERCLYITRQICDVLDCAHTLSPPLIHRDIKPSNIRIWNAAGMRDFVKLLDFGIAKQIGNTGFTRTGQLPGTPAYVSPEQVEGQALDARTDLYSLGIVLYEMLSGEQPFLGHSDYDTAWMRTRVDPPPLRAKNPHVDVHAERIVDGLLKRDRARRTAGAAALRDQLDAALSEPAIVTHRSGITPARGLPQQSAARFEPSAEPVTSSLVKNASRIKRSHLAWFAGGIVLTAIVALLAIPRNHDESTSTAKLPVPVSDSTSAVKADSVRSGSRLKDSIALQARYEADSTRLFSNWDSQVRAAAMAATKSWQDRYTTDSMKQALVIQGLRDSVRDLKMQLLAALNPPPPAPESRAASSGFALKPGDTTRIRFFIDRTIGIRPCHADYVTNLPDNCIAYLFGSEKDVIGILLVAPNGLENNIDVQTWKAPDKTKSLGPHAPLNALEGYQFEVSYDQNGSRLWFRFGKMAKAAEVRTPFRGEALRVEFCSRSLPIRFEKI